jgi:hypothetical protein
MVSPRDNMQLPDSQSSSAFVQKGEFVSPRPLRRVASGDDLKKKFLRKREGTDLKEKAPENPTKRDISDVVLNVDYE